MEETTILTFTLSATQSVETFVSLNWSGAGLDRAHTRNNVIRIPRGSRTATFSLTHQDEPTRRYGNIVIRITGAEDAQGAQVQVGDPSSVTVNMVQVAAPPDPPTNVSISMSGNTATVQYTGGLGASNHEVHLTRSTTVADDAAGSSSTTERLGWHRPISNYNTGNAQFTDLWTGNQSYPNTTYRFRIRAFNAHGVSPWVFFKGTSRGGTTDTPGTPEGLIVTPVDAQLMLRWTADAHASGYDVHYTSAPTTGGGAVTDDAAVQTVSAAAGWLEVSRSGTASVQTITGLSNNVAYRVRLRAQGTNPSAWTHDTGTPMKASDADLSRLALDTRNTRGVYSSLNIGTFAVSTTTYTGTVPYAQTHVRIRPTVASTGKATVGVRKGGAGSFTPVTSSRRSAAIALDQGSNTFTVRVTAEDGTTNKDYTITVTRQDPSTDADLSSLTVSSSTGLDGTYASVNFGNFGASTTTYTATIANDQVYVKLTPTVADIGKATVGVRKGASGNFTPVSSGTASTGVALSVGSNTITVQVTAEDGTTNKDYIITITREASTDANLSSLTASTSTSSIGAFNTLNIGTFNAGTIAYTATVPNAQTHVKITPTVADIGKATVTVQSTTVASSATSEAIALNVGSNTITVQVTAEDGSTTKDYTVTITRQASTDANLSSLTASTSTSSIGTFNTLNIGAFAAGTIAYTATVPNAQTHVKITPTVADIGKATVTVQSTTVASGTTSEAIALNVGSNTITVQVTAEDGSTTKDYTISITREAPSTNADLSGLVASTSTSSTGTFNTLNIGAFAAGTIAYTATVPNAQTHVKITPTVADIGKATVTVQSTTVASGTTSEAIALNVGSNTVTVQVTAEDGSTTKDYIITITREAPSTNADLSDLTARTSSSASGTFNTLDIGTFSSGTTSYTASVESFITHIKLTPTVTDLTATVRVGIGASLATVSSGSESDAIALSEGENILTVEVTAEDGTTTETYTVTVTRQQPLTVSLSAEPNPVQEGETVTITVTLPEALDSDVTISLILTSETAEPDDYDSTSPVNIDITAGQTEAEHTIETYEDGDIQDETFTVAINAENLPSGIILGSAASAEVTITDTDVPKVSLSVDQTSVEEGEAVTVTIALSDALDSEVTIPLILTSQTAESDDYNSTSPVNIDITAGETEAEHTINTYEDNDIEDETFTVALDAENLPSGIILGRAGSANITITDPDLPKVSLSVDQTSVEEGEGVTVTIALSDALPGTVTIPLILTPGTAESDDYDSTSPVNIDITAGQTETEHTIDTYEDNDSEDETLTIAIDAENLPSGIILEGTTSVEITITDNDTAGILAPVSLEINEGKSEAIQVSLATQPSSDVDVTVTGHEGTDLVPDPQVLTFSQDSYDTPQTVTLTTTEDVDLLSDEVTLTLAASGGGYNEVSHTLQVTIQDNMGVSIEAEEPAISITLGGNYPNPVSDLTNIVFDLPEPAHISIRVTDLLGRTVQTSPYGWYDAGTDHTIEIRTDNLTSGVYYYILRVDLGDRVIQRSKAMSIVR